MLGAALLIFICLVGIGITRRSDWKYVCMHWTLSRCFVPMYTFRFDDDEDESDKHLSDETISSATALLSKTPASGIIHCSKSPANTIRHRVRFQAEDQD